MGLAARRHRHHPRRFRAGALLRLEQLILEVAVNPPRAPDRRAVNVVIHIAGVAASAASKASPVSSVSDGTGYRLADALEHRFPS